MSTATDGTPSVALRPSARVPWFTVLALAVLMASADAFVLITVRGTVGAVSRSDGPFVGWLWHATLTLPVFAVAVHRVLVGGARRVRAGRRRRGVVVQALLVVAAGTGIGVVQLGASAVADYRLQSAQIESTAATHGHVGSSAPGQGEACDSSCAARRASLAVDLRAAGYASLVVVGANLVLVSWVVALRGGTLDAGSLRGAGRWTAPAAGEGGLSPR